MSYPGFTVEVINLEETIKALRELDSGMASMLKREIKRIATPTLTRAKGYASGLGSNPTGAFANSLALRTKSNGVKFVSTDPGGGVIEFANIGAVLLSGPHVGQRAPVPHTGQPPRALLRAILEDEESMVQDLNDAVAEYTDEVIRVG